MVLKKFICVTVCVIVIFNTYLSISVNSIDHKLRAGAGGYRAKGAKRDGGHTVRAGSVRPVGGKRFDGARVRGCGAKHWRQYYPQYYNEQFRAGGVLC